MNESKGWFRVIRVLNKKSSKFSCGMVDIKGTRYLKIIDRSKDKKHTVPASEILKPHPPLVTSSSPKTDCKIFEGFNDTMTKAAPLKDGHPYIDKLKEYKSTSNFIKTDEGYILAGYTNMHIFPKVIGIKKYPDKMCMKGSEVGENFCPHLYESTNTHFVLGEGFRECAFLASNAEGLGINVLEVGGVSNLNSVIKDIASKARKITILGDTDAKDEHNKLKKQHHITVVYPPKGKDFYDALDLGVSAESLMAIILNSDIKTSYYKPLGVNGNTIYLYAKLTHQVHAINPNKISDVLRVCSPDNGWVSWGKLKSKRAAEDIAFECIQKGSYDAKNEYKSGLWRYKGLYYFNTGNSVYYITPESIKRVSYSSVIDNSFLLIRGGAPKIPEFKKPYDIDVDLLESALTQCHWEGGDSSYGSLLLGWCCQALYAGVERFRPHLWLVGDSSQGKTWLSDWVFKNLLPIGKNQEGDDTTCAATRQDTAGHAVPVKKDEFGEADSVSASNVLEVLSLLRSAFNNESFIKKGQKSQDVIEQRVRFSALLSCIDPASRMSIQDFNRFIILKLDNSDNAAWRRAVRPKFNEFAENYKGRFIPYALSVYFLFKEYKEFFEDELNDYNELEGGILSSHKINSFTNCLAAYAALHKSKDKGMELFNTLKKSKSSPLNLSFDAFKGISYLDELLHKQVSMRQLYGINGGGHKSIGCLIAEGSKAFKEHGVDYFKDGYGIGTSKHRVLFKLKEFCFFLRHLRVINEDLSSFKKKIKKYLDKPQKGRFNGVSSTRQSFILPEDFR